MRRSAPVSLRSLRSLWLLSVLGATGCHALSARPVETEGPPGVVASSEVWGDPYDGAAAEVPFLPDQNVRYWRYAFASLPPGAILRVRGRLSGARYEAFDLYDEASRTSLGSVRDTALVTGTADDFVLYISDREDLDGPTLPLGKGGRSLFLRLYDPEGVVPVPVLPEVDLLLPGEDLPQPPPTASRHLQIPQALIDRVLSQREIPQRGERVDFYRIDDSGLYAAHDNLYLVAQITRAPGEVVLLSLEPPRFGPAGSAADVRYWSLTQCDRHSFCHHTVADHQLSAPLVPSDPIQLVIGDDDPALRAAAGARPFVTWATPDDELVLLYRNLATSADFGAALDRVPLFDFDQPAVGQEATLTLGTAAPQGIRCARAAFLAGTCAL